MNGVNGTGGVNGANGHAAPGASPSKVKKELPISMNAPTFRADQDEGDSPRLLTADNPAAGKAEMLPAAALTAKLEEKKQEEDVDGGREGDIYAEAALACSIENREACLMCSG